jgi:hypothetical protein
LIYICSQPPHEDCILAADAVIQIFEWTLQFYEKDRQVPTLSEKQWDGLARLPSRQVGI